MAYKIALVTLASLICYASGRAAGECEALARTEYGWVCGRQRQAHDGSPYASFRGVPYAKQPLGDLRFKELQPPEPWEGVFDASVEGPVCPFHDIFYGQLMTPRDVSEACIHVNVHVPKDALPEPSSNEEQSGCSDERSESSNERSGSSEEQSAGLPIVVFIHGGGWICGSGDADFNGPEYLVSKGVIVITFNYRLDVFGFLSLGTAKIPGNNGLRDAVTLLRWVQRNARAFGGDPRRVTLSGQSAGSTNAHLLALSPVTEGLFHRVWLMSGTAIPSYYTSSPAFTQQVATTYLSLLGLNGTDYDTVHDKLVEMPIEVLNNASGVLLAQFGVTSFVPVVESPIPGVVSMITDDPEVLIANGNGKNIPLMVGFTSNECETNRPRLTEIDAISLYEQNPLLALSPHAGFTLPANVTAVMAQKAAARYLSGGATMDKFIKLCTDTYFAYPSLKLARARAADGAPVYLYKFMYEAEESVFKKAFDLSYSGAGHAEDQNNILKVNSLSVSSSQDDSMKNWMSTLFANFVKTGNPSQDGSWPAVTSGSLKIYEIWRPQLQVNELRPEDAEMLAFFDDLPNV